MGAPDEKARANWKRRQATLLKLKSLTDYIVANPGLRFWQAVCSWSGEKAILFYRGRDLHALKANTADDEIHDSFFDE